MLIMLMLHTVMIILDRDTLLSEIKHIKAINIVIYLIMMFASGLAGLFLLVSATGNMISMQKHFQKRKSAKDLALKQIFGGFILLIFAMLSESVLNNHGLFGKMMKNIDSWGEYARSTDGLLLSLWKDGDKPFFTRFYHMETIHTIAWCVIVNGAIHAFLGRNDQWKDTTKMVQKYAILAVLILLLTPLVWWGIDQIIPGYPFDDLQYADLRDTNFAELVYKFWLLPLAGLPEPIFPYLAISFLGSIIGIYMTQEDKIQIKPRFFRNLIALGAIMCIIGLIGLLSNSVILFINGEMDAGLEVFTDLSRHRSYTNYNAEFDGFSLPIPGGWLFQFLFLNGFGLASTCMLIRAVEFRGKATQFANKTHFIRRFGVAPFTVYNLQGLIYVVGFLVYSISPSTFGGEKFTEMLWGGTIITVILVLALFTLLFWIWEKISYVGTTEWCIGEIAALLIPARRKAHQQKCEKDNRKPKWYDYGKMDANSIFYNAEWINIVEEDAIDHAKLPDSRYSYKLGWLSFTFLPLAFVSISIGLKSIKLEGKNKFNKRAIILGAIDILITLMWIIPMCILTSKQLGIPL
ncbi:hypothetical protein WKT22_02514 [Candidatus Lokiarchaeum ossiferum]